MAAMEIPCQDRGNDRDFQCRGDVDMFVPYLCHQEQIFDKKQEKKAYCVSIVKWKYRGHCGEEAMVVGVWGREELCAPLLSPFPFLFSLGLQPRGTVSLTFRVGITSSVKLLLTSSWTRPEMCLLADFTS